ncbi:MAG TPA: spermidine synthase [Verrucomicrobiales bacterium]|nr:spermidine synthase [Verrucomicrobiales bacterium]
MNGAAILVVEILGAKMLAPYLGTSHFVWTAQITVTLLSLAFGYYWGGRLVDRGQDLGRLYTAVLIAAIYLCLTIPTAGRIAYLCLEMKLATGSILASLFLFFPPLTLLAMTGPFLIRVLTSSVHGVGGQAGRLSAVSTLGSVGGAALIGYVLIPILPNSVIMLITAAVLVLLALVYRVRFRSRLSQAILPLVAGLAGVGIGLGAIRAEGNTDFNQGIELYRRNSNFGMLQVLQLRGTPMLFYANDYLTQNIYLTNTHQSGAMFTYMLHGLAHAYTPKIESALCIGMGVGIVPAQLAKDGARVDVVEINEAVVPLAQRFFDLDTNLFRLHIGDGRQFLNETHDRYDVVVLDAFLGDSCPSHLMTREAFTAIGRVLKPGGTLVMNCFGYFEYGRDYFVASLERTLSASFKSVRIHDSGEGNVFMVASDLPSLVYTPPGDLGHVYPPKLDEVQRAYVRVVSTDPAHGRVLTDDYNPVDYYDAANREHFRKNMALSMRPL